MYSLFRSVTARIHKSSVLSKLIVVNMIFIISLSGLLGYNYVYLKNDVKEQVLRTNEDFLEQLSGNLSKEWHEIRTSIYDISVSPDTKFLSINPRNSRSYQTALLGYKNMLLESNLKLPFRAQISVYFPNQDLVISGDGTRNLNVFYDSLETNNDQDSCRCLHESEQLEQLYNFNKMILFAYRLFPEGYIFAQVEKSELLAYLNSETKLLDNVIVIGDGTGHPIVSTAGEAKQLEETSAETVVIEGTKYTPIWKANSDFTYTVLFSDSLLQERLQRTNGYTFGLFAVFLVANLAFLLVNWSMFKPLRQLASTFNGWTAASATRNEFAIISDKFKQLNYATTSMQMEMTEQAAILEHNTLLRLLADEHYQMKHSVRQSLQHKFHSYMLLTLIEEDLHGKATGDYAEALETALGGACPFIHLHAQDDKRVYIVGCSKAEELEELIAQLLDSHSSPGEERHLLCGLSNVHTRLEAVGKALRESLDAIFKHVPDPGCMTRVLRYKEWNSEQETVFHLSIDKEQELVNYTLKGNSDAIIQFFDKMMDRTLKHMTFEQFRNMLRYLHDLLLVMMNSKKLNPSEIWDIAPDFNHTYHLMHLYNEIRKGYIDVAKRFALPNTPLLEQIKAYIDEHYANPDLSLTLIAEQFSITHVYLSSYFKKQSGYNLNHYMHTIRIQAAIRLMNSNSGLTMKEVAEQVGYSNAGTFIRHFKKISGTTPTQHAKLQQS
ncbi:helix-turn-helix domain-containing protein [Paenibacillus sp. J5C_2022]|uniref:helix-turn-helix domain-containing protein n=1 Tax=Paenibacillus sp. J5C2022 TaxID=2977129 RepID=UPI0021D30B96|nr:helix-turn-helix domain-containing protein [Paenibacillus sp. J5C2022]MCU6707749.1 helix-turn-helix domain-containing protein [Paenibacillus sp. J5C2022]